MTRTADCPHEENLGVYILGALELEEREQFESHLAGCDSCLRGLAPLAGLPGLLKDADPAEVFAIAAGAEASRVVELPAARLNGHDPAAPDGDWSAEPPGGLLATVHDIGSARRRKRALRWAGSAAAAVVLVVAGVAGGSLAARPGQPPAAASQTDGQTFGTPAGPWQTISSPPSSGPGAVVMYRQMGWGTQLEAKVTGLPPGVRCQMTVLTSGGSAVTAGSWDTDAEAGTVDYPASADVTAASIKEIVITAGNRPPITIRA
jgi:hypothetical protein